MPVTRGYNINKVLQTQSDFLVATSDCHLLKYDTTLGYAGYYKTQNIDEIYDTVSLPQQTDLIVICGSSDTVEVVRISHNQLVVRLVL